MTTEAAPEHLPLRLFMVVDATLLLILGVAMVLIPEKAAALFHVNNLPPITNYITGLFGCAFISMGIGNAIAAGDPVRNISWIWAGLARSVIEAIFGFVCILRGIATWSQAGFCIITAALVAVIYLVLYPRK